MKWKKGSFKKREKVRGSEGEPRLREETKGSVGTRGKGKGKERK